LQQYCCFEVPVFSVISVTLGRAAIAATLFASWGDLMNGRSRQALVAVLITAHGVLPTGSAAAAQTLSITLDQARIIKSPNRVGGTIVVGNPLIADVSVQPDGLLVITGKGYGRTNIIVLDSGGAVLMETLVEVRGPRDTLVLYRGPDRESYSCAPKCERRITLGDANAYFDAILAETTSRNAQAMGAGPAAAPTR
jgi:hypothetical protein